MARASVLRERAAFEAVLRSGCRIPSRNFVLRARPNELGHARLGIIAGSKAVPRAVDRNRGKRLIREAFHLAALGLGAFDVTVQLKSDLRRESAATVRQELKDILEKLARRAINTSTTERQQT